MNAEPVALLPVRLETRFSSDGTVLRVRVFPDDLHVDTLDRGLSGTEQAAGRAYWTAVWGSAPPEATMPGDAWAVLVTVVGPRRAPWVVEALRPINLALRPAAPPEFPPVGERSASGAQVLTLPTAFHGFAYQGADVSHGQGGPVRRPLPVGLAGALGEPAPDGGEPMRFVNGVPVVDPGLEWLVDFEAAGQAGMAFEIPLRQPRQPVSRLVVVGVRDDLDAADASTLLAELFTAHLYTDGAAFVPQGSPTNNTETDRTAWSRAAAIPGPAEPVEPAEGSNAADLARALDVPAATFAPLDHAAEREQERAQAMATLLWGTTWEVVFAKLTHPATPGRSFTPEQREELRRHALLHVRGRGSLPALRIGRQPYGVLPTTTFGPGGYRPTTLGISDSGLIDFLRTTRTLWRAGVGGVPTVMSGGVDAMPEILGSSPVMLGLRARSVTQVNKCFEPLPFLTGTQDNCATQEGIDAIVHEFLGFDPSEVTPTGLLGQDTNVVALPLVDDTDLGYLAELRANGVAPGREQTVFQALLGLAFATEYDDWEHATGDDIIPRLEGHLAAATGLVDVQAVRAGLGAIRAAMPAAAPLAGAVSLAGAVPLAGTVSLAQNALAAIERVDGVVWMDRHTVAAAYPVAAVRPPTLYAAATRGHEAVLDTDKRVLGLAAAVLRRHLRREEFFAAADVLSTVTSNDERALLLREVLDTASHRFDAWLTSLATSRLAGQRTGGVRGTGLGAYGFVENIPFRPPTPVADEPGTFVSADDDGFLYAPSLDHATTAGLLRSGRLSHGPGTNGQQALDIDLSSGRVRTALYILDGIRQGQSLGALLGYRLERRLHDLRLDRYVYVLRGVAPLRAAKQTEPEAGAAPAGLESVSAADVVDGVRLLELFETPGGPATIRARLVDGPNDATVTTYLGHWEPASTDDQSRVLGAIAGLDQVHDAVADLLLAESVHQMARGNLTGAAAALDAAAGDGAPPEPDVIRTPRSGTAYTHHLVVLTPNGPGPAGWRDDAPRAQAHPQLEAWARVQLGPASRFVLGVDPLDTLADHALCALDVVLDAGPVLRARLAVAPLAVRPATWRRGVDRLLLAEAEELARSLRQLLAAARPMTGATLAAPLERSAPRRTPDLAALLTRVSVARSGLDERRTVLLAALAAGGDPGPVLASLYAWGIASGALSGAPPGTPVDELRRIAGATVPLLDGRLRDTDAALEAARAAQAELDGLSVLGPVDPEVRARHQDDELLALGDALAAALGAGLPAVTDLLPPDGAGPGDQLAAALADDPDRRPSGAEVRDWLAHWVSVRPGAARYGETALLREALGTSLTYRVLQLPFDQETSWIGLPFSATTKPLDGPVNDVVVELSAGSVPTGRDRLAGFLVDEWTDVVPRRILVAHGEQPARPEPVAVTAAAVNAHGPSARPPQAVLLAITPDGQPWTVDTLRAVVEDTFALAQERGVTLERVPLAPRILPALYVDDWTLSGQSKPVLDFAALNRAVGARVFVTKYVSG